LPSTTPSSDGPSVRTVVILTVAAFGIYNILNNMVVQKR
jgi:hypothetical protein